MVYIYSSIEKDLPLRNLWCLINMYVRFTCAHNAGPFNNCLAHNQLHTRAVHKLLRQCKLKGTWKRYKLDFTWMDSSTLFLSTCTISITWLHSTDCWEQKKSIIWRYADVANVTSAGYNGVIVIVTVSLFLYVHTIQLNVLHIKLNPLINNISSVNILCADVTEMLFGRTIPLKVWRAQHCSEQCWRQISLIMVCLQVNLSLVGPRNFWKNVCAIDRLMLGKHCFHSVCFQ